MVRISLKENMKRNIFTRWMMCDVGDGDMMRVVGETNKLTSGSFPTDN